MTSSAAELEWWSSRRKHWWTHETRFSHASIFAWSPDEKWKVPPARAATINFPDFDLMFSQFGIRGESEAATLLQRRCRAIDWQRTRILAES